MKTFFTILFGLAFSAVSIVFSLYVTGFIFALSMFTFNFVNRAIFGL